MTALSFVVYSQTGNVSSEKHVREVSELERCFSRLVVMHKMRVKGCAFSSMGERVSLVNMLLGINVAPVDKVSVLQFLHKQHVVSRPESLVGLMSDIVKLYIDKNNAFESVGLLEQVDTIASLTDFSKYLFGQDDDISQVNGLGLVERKWLQNYCKLTGLTSLHDALDFTVSSARGIKRHFFEMNNPRQDTPPTKMRMLEDIEMDIQ